MRHEMTLPLLNPWLRLFYHCRCAAVTFSEPVVECFLTLEWVEEYRPKCFRPTAKGEMMMGLRRAA